MPLEPMPDPQGSPYWSEEDGRTYKSCALLAVGHGGEIAVLDHFGPAIDWHAEHYSATADELGFTEYSGLDPGIYVWVGTMGSKRFDTLDGLEWDHVIDGELRPPTVEEWATLQAGQPLWNKDTCPKWNPPKRRNPDNHEAFRFE